MSATEYVSSALLRKTALLKVCLEISNHDIKQTYRKRIGHLARHEPTSNRQSFHGLGDDRHGSCDCRPCGPGGLLVYDRNKLLDPVAKIAFRNSIQSGTGGGQRSADRYP